MHRSVPSVLGLALLLVLRGGAIAAAQTPATVRLGTPETELAEPLATVTDIRELKDGRVLVVDSRRNAVLVANMQAGTVGVVGTLGEAPGGYCHPTRAIALPADSTIIFDAARRRFILVAPDLSTRAYTQLGDSATLSPIIGRLASGGSDGAGRLYSVGLGSLVSGFETVKNYDSLAIERWKRSPLKADTIAFMPTPLKPGTQPYATPVPPRRPLASRDQWAVGTDGRVAIVHLAPYRVDIVGEDGKRVTGVALPTSAIPVTEADRQAVLRDLPYSGDGGYPPVTRAGPGRCGALGAGPNLSHGVEWADVMPAFPLDAVRFAPDGALWIRRSTSAGQPAAFDVIDRAAKLAAHVVLPPNTEIVGFGASSIYAVRVDDAHAHFLERFRRPDLKANP